MSKPNPFQRGSSSPGSQQPPPLSSLAAAAAAAPPNPNTRQPFQPMPPQTPPQFTSKPPQQQPIPGQAQPKADLFGGEALGRNFSRSGVRAEEERAKKTQYRHFIQDQHSSSNLMAKTAGRKMGIDTKRPAHKVWMTLMAGMSLYIVGKWAFALSKPKFFTIFDMPNAGYSTSLMSPTELQLLGPLGDQPKYTGKQHKSLQEQHDEKKQRAAFEELSEVEKEKQVPCYQFGREFKQCLAPGNITRKLDQCIMPLQQYNMCLLQYRTGMVPSGHAKLALDLDVTGAKPMEIYQVAVEHGDYKYS